MTSLKPFVYYRVTRRRLGDHANILTACIGAQIRKTRVDEPVMEHGQCIVLVECGKLTAAGRLAGLDKSLQFKS